MNISPKFAENDTVIKNIFSPYMQGTYEIQLLSTDLKTAIINALRLVENIRSKFTVHVVTLHMPFGVHLIEHGLMWNTLGINTVNMIHTMIQYSQVTGIKMNLLFHAETSSGNIVYKHLVEYVHKISTIIQGTNVGILLENEIMSFNDSNLFPSFEICNTVKSDNISSCFDLCHFKSSENAFRTKLILPSKYVNRIKWVHFSATTKKLGFKDKANTHSKAHNTITDVNNDLLALIKYGIDLNKVVLVTEICESDYKNRPDMLKELRFLHKLK